ncbi:hypothetical protein PGB90_006536 [Kerria lacca]
MLCVNMIGDFEKLLIIGKAKKPRCFKNFNVDRLNMTWEANQKAWMTADIMTQWLLSFDKKMKMQKRQVLLFMDNATSHPIQLQLKNVKIIFFPPNTTSHDPSTSITEQQTDYDYPTNDSLMAKLPSHMQAIDYEEIDADLSTEETGDDISVFIPTKIPEDLTDEEDFEEELDSSPPSNVTNYSEALQNIKELTKFVTLHGDTEALQPLSQLRLRLEKAAITSSAVKQTTIPSFFKK